MDGRDFGEAVDGLIKAAIGCGTALLVAVGVLLAVVIGMGVFIATH